MPLKRSTLALALALAAAAAAPAAAQEELPAPERYHLRLEYLWWSPQPGGQLQKGFSDQEGTLLGVEELGIQGHRANELRAALRLGTSWKLRGSWSPIDFRGDVAAARPFVYGTVDVLLAQRVITSLKGNYGSAELEWDFLKRPQGFLGVLAGARIVDVDTLLLNVDTSDRVLETERLPIPSFGLTGRLYLDRRFSLEGELSGLTIGERGHIWELHAAARFHVSDHLAASGGYRRIELEGRTDRDFLKLGLGRWTLGVEISL
jgi:hypothetical protein